MKHTPGPWSFEQDMRGDGVPLPEWTVFDESLVEEGHDDCYIAQVHSLNHARLIAAAPDLLGALKECLPFLADSTMKGHLEQYDNVRELIAKAEEA